MEVKIKTFDELTTKELYEILKLRADVFVVEQNCIYPDLDDIDYRSIHIFYENEDETIAAYLRFFKKGGRAVGYPSKRPESADFFRRAL